jgi:D-aminopeptidase
VSGSRPRARELGLEVPGTPGELNLLTDVPGVEVGQLTLVRGDGPLRVGEGPVRTGVTVVLPAEDVWRRPVFAGLHVLNGNGEITGAAWIGEAGTLDTPVALTNTHSVGVVRDALVAAARRASPGAPVWSLPVVAETWDGVLNDVDGHHVRAEHLDAALRDAAGGPVAEGAVGGGTGMVCHGFKGGIGTASRRVAAGGASFTVGVLVQANHGRREQLVVDGVPVGRLVGEDVVAPPRPPEAAPPGAGSVVVVVATDAPLLPHQARRAAQRAALGLARTGATAEHSSGDLLLAFSTATRLAPEPQPADPVAVDVPMLSNHHITAVFDAVVEATEGAVLNALLGARDLTGRDGVLAHALPHDLLREHLAAWRAGATP